MSGRCKDCHSWMRDGMLAQRGTGGRVLRAMCGDRRSPHRGEMTPSSVAHAAAARRCGETCA